MAGHDEMRRLILGRDPTPRWSEISQRRFETGQDSVNPPAPAAEICLICKKEFKSKYALMGHSRVHGGMGADTAADGVNSQVNIEPVGSGSGSTMPRTSSENQRKRPLISDSTDKARTTKSQSAHHRPRPKQPDGTEIRIKGLHECEICKERFSTGQALGGHKTKHRRGPPREIAREHEIPRGGQQRKAPLDIDLNELPPMEEEDDQEAAEPADRA